MADQHGCVCAWTNHAIKRLGERFGSTSDQIKKRIEELIAENSFTVDTARQVQPNTICIWLTVVDNPIGLVINNEAGKDLVVITVLPKQTVRESQKRYSRPNQRSKVANNYKKRRVEVERSFEDEEY